MNLLERVRRYTHRLLTRPVDELRRGQRALRYSIDLALLAVRAMRQRRMALMASALTFQTIFALVPTAIVVLIIFRAVLSYENAERLVRENAYRLLNVEALTYGMTGEESLALRATIDQRINEFLQHAYHLETGQLGLAGGLLLLWAVTGLIITVERCFNTIYEAPEGRPWLQRITVYWAIMTLAPLLLVFSLYIARRLTEEAASIPGMGPVLAFLGRFSGLAAVWLLLLLLYTLMPTAKVKLRPALIGSFVAAALWKLGQWGFGVYAQSAVGYSKIYGTLSLIPLGLIWLHLSWLITLFGLHLTHALQYVRPKGDSQNEPGG